MTLRHRIRFYQQLAVLVRAGVPLRASLERLQERLAENEVAVLSRQVNAGEKLGDAFAAAGFSPFECHLVVAGEKSAQLDTIFQHLSEFWARQLEMRQEILRPLYYPVAMLHLAILMGALVELAYSSWPRVVVHFIGYMVALYAVGFLVYLAVRVSWSNELGRRIWLRVPMIGSFLSTAYAYRWITALRLEFSAGISLPGAVADAWRASGYFGAERLAGEGQKAMWEGAQLSALVQRWKQLPRDWVDFIETGEISGDLEAAFRNLDAEAARAWTLAQRRMAEWMPKILYFIILLIVAAVIIWVGLKVYVDPIENLEK